MRAFYRFAHESKWIAENPALKLKQPRVSQRPTLPFIHDEMMKILAALSQYIEQASPRARAFRLRALVLLLRYTGMRIGDVVKLTTDKIVGNKVFLYTQKTGVPVHVSLPQFVVQVLDATPHVAAKHLFSSGVGSIDGVLGSWRKRLQKLFRLANIVDGHAHRFRDTFATELLQAGAPIERVAVLLGHQSVRVIEKYYSPWTESRQRQIESDLERTWARDPILLLETEGTPQVHERN